MEPMHSRTNERAKSPAQRLPARHSLANGIELEPGISVPTELEKQPLELRQDNTGRVPLSELLDDRPESVRGLLRIQLLSSRNDVVDPMEQLNVIEIRE